jgi:hypothetical protein
MTTNYDASQPGVPYVRASRIDINYPPASEGMPYARIEQREAVVLADLSVRQLGPLPTLEATFNLTDQTLLPLVDPETGGALPAPVISALSGMVASGNVNLQFVMLCLLAVVRREQIAQQPEV